MRNTVAEWEMRKKTGLSSFVFSSVDSTNVRAREYAESHPGESAVFFAERQTKGQGSRGRSFSSKRGGMYLSILIGDPKGDAVDFPALTGYAAVVSCRAIEALSGVTPDIKWVNDLYLHGRKMAGILTEGAFDGAGNLRYAIVGIGINLRKGILPPELSEIATTLEEESGIRLSPFRTATEIAARFIKGLSAPKSREVLSYYQSRMFLVGKSVTVESKGEPYGVTILSVNDDYSLTVQREDRNTENLFSGEIKIKM